jgi:hypothetical protein
VPIFIENAKKPAIAYSFREYLKLVCWSMPGVTKWNFKGYYHQ